MNNLSSMTKEELEKFIHDCQIDGNHKLANTLCELLAFREAAEKPVAYIPKSALDKIAGGADGACCNIHSGRFKQRSVGVFTAPPLPVVPEGITHEQREILIKTAKVMFERHPTSDYSANIREVARIALMLLESGNSPEIPDGWVSVSDRLPDDNSDVLCTSEFDGPGDWRKKVGYYHDGKWVVYGASWTPTHWMLLPEAPKPEVK